METKQKSKTVSKRLILPKEVNEMYATSRYLQPYSLFFNMNKEIPIKLQFPNIDKNALLELILNEFKISEKDLIMSKRYDFTDGKYELNSVIIPIRKNLLVYFNPGGHDAPGVELLYSPLAPESTINLLEELIKSLHTRSSNVGKINLLQRSHGSYDLTPFEIKKQGIDILKHYNDDFDVVNSVIKTRLNNDDDKGLVLLHGKPGTGKTSYIRYLTSQVNKRMIFLSPEMMSIISSPDFVGVLSEYPNSVIIIEDAENVIEERKGGGSSAISNLLNLTDGLLADCLKIQLICSFNTDVSRIDKALLRKGRLIAKYEFKALEQSKAQELSNSLGFKTTLNKDTALSEIFNQDEKEFQSEKDVKIGFNLADKKVA